MKSIKYIYHWILRSKKKLSNELLGDRNYKKFIIVSRSRTGSTLLMALLNKHTSIVCEGELFKKLNGKSCKEIWNDLFSKRPKKTSYVGCKLFYYHPFDDDKDVWDLMDKEKGLTIIHLTRKNYLEAYVSQKIGEQTRQWSESKFKPHNLSLEEKRITLDIAQCEETFENISKYEKDTVARFNGQHFIEIDYSDLSKDKEGVMARIFQELKVPLEKVEVVNKKQNTEPLDLLVNNYKELKEYFKNTNWEYLFK